MAKSNEEKTAKNKGKESNSSTQETTDKRNSNETKENSKKNQTKSKDNDKHADNGKSSARKDYCEEELDRLRKSLQQTAEEMKEKKPEIREFYPDTFNALEPYCDVHDPQFLLSQTDDFRSGYTARFTAIEIPTPWLSHRLDVEVPPRDVANLSKKQNGEKTGTTEQAGTARKTEKNTKGDVGGSGGTREAGAAKRTGEARGNGGTRKAGGTDGDGSSQDSSSSLDTISHTGPPTVYRRLVVDTTSFPKKEKLSFTDVPKIRREMSEATDEWKKNEGYKRTKADFYRLKLNEMDEYAPHTRPRMKEAYLAYLQNTPGSKKAVTECIREIEKKESSRTETASNKPKPNRPNSTRNHRSEEK